MNKNKILNASMWSVTQQWSGKLLNFLTFAILTRLLNPEEFGLIALALVCLNFIEIFVSQGLGFAIIQKKDLQTGHIDTAFWINVILGGITTIIIIFLSKPISLMLKQPKLADVLVGLSIYLFINGLSRIQSALLVKEMEFKKLALRTFFANISGAIIGITMAFNGYGVWSLVGQQLGVAIIGSFVLWFASNWKPSFSFSFKYAKDLYSYGLKVSLDSLLTFFNLRLDELLIANFLSIASLGYYSVAKKVVSFLNDILIRVIQTVALPVFSKVQDDKNMLMKIFNQSVSKLSYIIVPIFLGLCCYSSLTVDVFGEKWISSVVLISILSFTGITSLASTFTMPILYAMGKPNYSVILKMLRSILTVVLITIGIKFGIIGVAIAVVAREMVGALLDLIFIKKTISLFKLRSFILMILKPILYSIPMVVLSFPLRSIYQTYQCMISMDILKILFSIVPVSLAAVIYLLTIIIFDKNIVIQYFSLIINYIKKKD